jgi:hypothetical protein
VALNRHSGRTLWRREVEYESLGDIQTISTPATATLVVDGDRVHA